MIEHSHESLRVIEVPYFLSNYDPDALPAGQALRAPAPLFKKLDESVIEEEYARLAT